MIRRMLGWIVGLGVLLLGYYSLAHYAGWPGLIGVAHAVGKTWKEGLLPHDIEVSAARWMLGWIPGAVLGVGIGLVSGRIILARHTLEPFRLLLRALPFIGLVPVVIRLFGTSEEGKVLLIAWVACSVCWPIVDSASSAIPITVMWRAETLGAGPLDRFRIVWLYCRRSIYSALRTSLSLAWIVVATVEMAGVFQRSTGSFWSEGLGYRLFRAEEEGQDGLLIGALLLFALVGAIGEILHVGIWRGVLKISLKWRQRRGSKFIQSLSANNDEGNLAWQNAGELEIRELATQYDGRQVFSHCSFVVSAGETITVVGKSGCGKSTLLRAIANLAGHDLRITGKILINGSETGTDQSVGLVFQDALVIPLLTVWENVVFGRQARKKPENAYQLLAAFGLDGLVGRLAEKLSGGQRQRLALACALANYPEVLLLDEPFGALDAITRRQLQEQFAEHVRGLTSCVLVTHDIDEAVELSSGRVMVGIGSESELIAVPNPDFRGEDWKATAEYARLRQHLLHSLDRQPIR